jgi:Ca2+-binding EF-hand superfamily protein
MRRILFALTLSAFALFAVTSPLSAAPKIPAAVKKKAEGLFDKADTNHDGKISKEEFRKALSHVGLVKIPASVADKLFAKLDTNKDGYLTKAEIKGLAKKLAGMHPHLTKASLAKLFGKLKNDVVHKIASKLKGIL